MARSVSLESSRGAKAAHQATPVSTLRQHISTTGSPTSLVTTDTIVVEVVAMQRQDDPARDVGDVEPVNQRGRRLRADIARIGEDGHPRDAVRPLPAP